MEGMDRPPPPRVELSEDEIVRQRRQMMAPPSPLRLDRPCTLGDGIRRLGPEEADRYADLGAKEVATKRVCKFVPASGAATRMFQDILTWQSAHRGFLLRDLVAAESAGDKDARSVLTTLHHLRRFAWYPQLVEVLARRGRDPGTMEKDGDATPLVSALLEEDGLAGADSPKALWPFHLEADGARSAFAQHLDEAASYAVGADGNCHVHFTVSAAHREKFESARARLLSTMERRHGRHYVVEFSEQDPATDTIVISEDGAPMRRAGQLILRQSGHGALLGNLKALDADLVFIRNIDNVDCDRDRALRAHWSRVLAGVLSEARARLTALDEALDGAGGGSDVEALERAATGLRDICGIDLTPLVVALPVAEPLVADHDAVSVRAEIRDRLRRPLRVCGMVPISGESGGGPFWVRGADGRLSLQIVETAQVAPSDDQQAIFASSTHFNPVDMVVALTDGHGQKVDIESHVDHDAVIVTSKNMDGRQVRVLERPGLWNGSMAGWNTIFVELPADVFNPVKTVNDLLRDHHQPLNSSSPSPSMPPSPTVPPSPSA